MMLHSWYLPLNILLLILYSLMSYAVGANLHFHFARHGTGVDELLVGIDDMRDLASSVCLVFIPAVLYILPLIDIRNGSIRNASATVFPLSLPISRKEYACSRLLYTGISSMILVILFTGLAAAGIWYRSGSFWAEAGMAVRVWFAFVSLAIHVAGMLSVAVCLGVKNFVIPVTAILIAVMVFIKLISPGVIYQLALSPFFRPAAVVFIIAVDAISAILGISRFGTRDI